MTRDLWRKLVYRGDWDRISDDERARRVEAAVTPRVVRPGLFDMPEFDPCKPGRQASF